MFLYNVTIIVENDIRDDVRKRIETLLFTHEGKKLPVALLEMLDSPHEGTTYCVQLRSENMEGITSFQTHHLAAIQQLATKEYPTKILLFDSTMKYIKHG
ncbi:DUF4286 family protein [Parapedobacter tibetensis]|uniref:DUF4286 family protein n=1 Tax=Parapedobacter tibetensis TaxID=2972951 RepID=UPI00214D9B17|nr:DUF4286 family protein [Parapedobacter tibetensis]